MLQRLSLQERCHLPCVQDEFGVSLLAYAAGIGNPRLNQLLQILLEHKSTPQRALATCTPPHAAMCGQAAPTMALQGLVTSLIDLPVTAGLGFTARAKHWLLPRTRQNLQDHALSFTTGTQVIQPECSFRQATARLETLPPCQAALSKLARQRSDHTAVMWDWQSTAGLLADSCVWNTLELAMLADFPSRVQVGSPRILCAMSASHMLNCSIAILWARGPSWPVLFTRLRVLHQL